MGSLNFDQFDYLPIPSNLDIYESIGNQDIGNVFPHDEASIKSEIDDTYKSPTHYFMKIPSTSETQEANFECRFNNEKCPSNSTVQSFESKFICTHCGKTFSKQSDLDCHYDTHMPMESYECSICKKSFVRKYNLMVHERIHTDERPYECNICGLKFRRSSTRTLHMRIHTNEKPFTCSICGKTFSKSGNLNVHMKIHVFFYQ